MKQLIDDMKAIPGVIGACTYSSQMGITNNNLPSLFKDDRLVSTAKHLAKIHAAGRLNFPDLTEVMVNYDESVVVFRQLNMNDHLITICDPGVNMNLLSMSLNLAVENLPDESPNTSGTATADATPQEKPAAFNIDSIMNKGPMAAPLQTMSKLLAKVIGPMAKIIFEDAVAGWLADQGSEKKSLSKLLERVCREIGDEEKSNEYRQLVRQKMASRQGSRNPEA